MIRRPPRSTLFPYPTLFPSFRFRADHREDGQGPGARAQPGETLRSVRQADVLPHLRARFIRPEQGVRDMRRGPGWAAGSRRRGDGGPLVPVRRRGGELMGGDTPERWGGDNPQLSTRYRNVPPWNVPGGNISVPASR